MTRPLIVNITKSSDIRAALRYDLIGKDPAHPRSNASIIACSLPTTDADEIVRAIQRTLDQHRKLKNPLCRVSLSLPSGVRLNPISWRLCAIFWMRIMHIDPDRVDWYLAHHPTQTDHDHCHLTFCRIAHSDPPGIKGGTGAWRSWNSYRRGQAACITVAAQLGLDTLAEEVSIAPTPERAKSAALESLLTSLLSRSQTLPQLFQALRENDVVPKLHIASTGRISGISFRQGKGPVFKGSSLKFPWRRIRDLVDFDAKRDLPLLGSEPPDIQDTSISNPTTTTGESYAGRGDRLRSERHLAPSLRHPARSRPSSLQTDRYLGHRDQEALEERLRPTPEPRNQGDRLPEAPQITSQPQFPSRTIASGACAPGTRRLGRCSRPHTSPPLLNSNPNRLKSNMGCRYI